ncbi:Uncharacterised protein [Klebsiella pneumoniae]|uniref:Uncharacterized protein n=1 Tax=Klebsiella pneumoniae TaxID=573 RepID=A0A3S4IPT6_KLEPN|nr:Uncharacterised protein [Klebsiella pneumoniae]
MAGEDPTVSMSTLPSIRCTPAFFQRRHHIANILPFKRRIAAEARNQVAFQHAAVKGTFGFQRGGKAKIGPQLQQRRQRGDDLLRTGRERHLLAVIVDFRRRCADLLRHKGKVRTGGKLVDVLVNIRRLSAKRYTGGQSDDKSGKSHNLALTT